MIKKKESKAVPLVLIDPNMWVTTVSAVLNFHNIELGSLFFFYFFFNTTLKHMKVL